MSRVAPTILFMLAICVPAACSGGSGGECTVSSDCAPGLVCSMHNCVSSIPGPDADAMDGEGGADPLPDPDGESFDTPREEVHETGPETPDAPPDADVPGDVPDEDGETPAGIVGDPCTVAEDCAGVPDAGRQCLTDVMGIITFEGGYCTTACTADPDCGDTTAICVSITITSYCFRSCTTAEECRSEEGYVCDKLATDTGDRTYCIPSTTP